MPFAAIASAVSRTTFSLILSQANVFQLFQPIGGVRARPSHFWARTGVARQRSKYNSFFISSNQFLFMISLLSGRSFQSLYLTVVNLYGPTPSAEIVRGRGS